MTFTPGQPENGQSLGASKVPIRDNFTAIVADLGVNHVAINLADQGKHKFLQLPEQGSAPTTAVNEGGFYAKVGTSPAETSLFFRAENSGFEYRMTRPVAASTALFATNTAYAADHTGGWTFLPGGLLLQYGARTTPGSSGTITFPITFTTGYYSITIGLSRNNSSSVQNTYIDNSVAVSLTSFAYDNTSSSTDPIYWMAIGF
jgi:hypothetical protein